MPLTGTQNFSVPATSKKSIGGRYQIPSSVYRKTFGFIAIFSQHKPKHSEETINMGHYQIPDDQVAAYGQIGLAVMSLLIAVFYKESQNRVMTSDWGKAFFWRRILWITIPCFFILSLLVLLAAFSKKSPSSGSGVSTLLVAVITVFFLAANESCPIRDILDLRVSEIDVAVGLNDGDHGSRLLSPAVCPSEAIVSVCRGCD
jgi:hypothetical protein